MIESQLYNGTAASTQTSVPFQIDDLNTYGVEVVFSGGAGNLVGVLTLEASVLGITYVSVAGSAQTVAASENHVYDVSGAGYKWFRIVWTYTSGTGNMVISTLVKQPTNRF